MDSIYYEGTLLGFRIRSMPHGSKPISDSTHSLQLLTIKHPQNSLVKPHRHLPTKRHTLNLQECLIVKSGKIRIDLYGPTNHKVRSVLLKSGQAFVTINGGHSIRFLEDSEVYEIKNGPFKEDKELI